MQPAKGPPSIEHWKLAPASELKLKLGLAELLGFVGEPLMFAAGATVSTVQENPATGPVFPAPSVAFTCKVCEPSAIPL